MQPLKKPNPTCNMAVKFSMRTTWVRQLTRSKTGPKTKESRSNCTVILTRKQIWLLTKRGAPSLVTGTEPLKMAVTTLSRRNWCSTWKLRMSLLVSSPNKVHPRALELCALQLKERSVRQLRCSATCKIAAAPPMFCLATRMQPPWDRQTHI